MTHSAPSPFCLQNMPPAAARFCLDMERFCREELYCDIAGSSVLVAFSGGADSLALLLALHALAPKLTLTLHAAILDHGLRPESVGEVFAAEKLCDSLDIAFHSRRVDVGALAKERGTGLEEAGREARLAFLEELRAELSGQGCVWVALGHQLNDLAEDSLMRLIRGAGWPALAGMRGIDLQRRIIRPLLLTPRSAIEDFLRSLGQNWNQDPMNEDEAYLRNRVRARVLPLFMRENPAFLDAVAIRWRMAREDAVFFGEMAEGVKAEIDGRSIFFSRDTLAAAARSVRLRAYKAALERLGPGEILGPSLLALDRVWQKGEGGKTMQFSGCKTARIQKGGIAFTVNAD